MKDCDISDVSNITRKKTTVLITTVRKNCDTGSGQLLIKLNYLCPYIHRNIT